ncbi:MAG: hypothetical protein MSG64_17270 [Pyrinomonadaceae bacterium MAG19_C2-C3]|nr:hypothetical protein [Pyrinomonadaceae bacterium MAG19_C2-C3]
MNFNIDCNFVHIFMEGDFPLVKNHISRFGAVCAALCCCAFLFASDARAQTAFGVTTGGNTLVRFNLTTPDAITTRANAS